MPPKRGTNKHKSVEHEKWIAQKYLGRRTSNSGASDIDKGDVRAGRFLYECKVTGEYDKPATGYRITLKEFEKAFEEACRYDLYPAMAVRLRAPDSPLADKDGNVEFVVRLVRDDWSFDD